MSWRRWLADGLAELDGRAQRRALGPALTPTERPLVVHDGERELVLFSTNDYLGLAQHPEVLAAASAAASATMGPRAAPLISGYSDEHAALERELAELDGTPSALLTPTGFAANAGPLAAIAGPDLVIFSDALNHASIVDGCGLARRAGARLVVYPHADAEALARLLAEHPAPRQLIVSDAVFSMDGDLAPLAELAALKERAGALLMIDFAHAALLWDGGLPAAVGCPASSIDLHVGTLSKAFGAHGGYIGCNADWRDWLLNRSRPFVFSTAAPRPVLAAARAALRVAREQPELRERLWRHVQRLRDALGQELKSPIVPVPIGDESRTLAAATALRARGLHVGAVRPPTVPAGGSRLRIALSAAHEDADVERLIAALDELALLR